MLIGQMSFPKLSPYADYVQLDICGLTAEEAVAKAQKYRGKPLILHGDWEKKGNSENNLIERLPEYIRIIQGLRVEFELLGFTLHPPKRKKVPYEAFLSSVKQLQQYIPVFVENRSNAKLYCSLPEEVVSLSHEAPFYMTIDIPQLFIACQYNMECFKTILKEINWDHIKEVHLANIMREGSHTYVGRKLTEGLLDMRDIIPFIYTVPHITLEILGGIPTFEIMRETLKPQNLVLKKESYE